MFINGWLSAPAGKMVTAGRYRLNDNVVTQIHANGIGVGTGSVCVQLFSGSLYSTAVCRADIYGKVPGRRT